MKQHGAIFSVQPEVSGIASSKDQNGTKANKNMKQGKRCGRESEVAGLGLVHGAGNAFSGCLGCYALLLFPALFPNRFQDPLH